MKTNMYIDSCIHFMNNEFVNYQVDGVDGDEGESRSVLDHSFTLILDPFSLILDPRPLILDP